MSLNKHTATINDELLNPLTSSENEFSYLSADPSIDVREENELQVKNNAVEIRMIIALSGNLQIEGRTRYNVWDLLGDVGGFHDGLHLLASGFVAIYASLAF